MKNALYTLGLFLFLEVATWAQPALNITSLSPPRQVVALGGSLTLSVTATGATSYQWQRNGLSVSGATAATFVVSNASPARDGGRYEVRVSNGGTNTFDSVLSPSVFVLVGSASTTRVAAWGDNSYGQTSVPTALDGVVAISAGQNHTVALKPSGTVVAWGYNGDGRIFKGATDVPRGLNDVVSVSAGGGYTLALKQDGTVVDWGEPNIGNRGENSLPTALGSQTDVAAVSAGAYHALGLTKAGGVFAWGNNTLGQCNIPTSVTASRIAAVAAGGASGGSLVLTNQGTLVKWPSYIGIAPMPAGLQNVVAIASGASFSLALKQDGTVVAWGYNDNGEISVPTGLNGVVAIAAGDYHALALKQDGRVVAWGYNRFGQCNVPPDLGPCSSVAGGFHHSIALRTDGIVRCWGWNYIGQCNTPANVAKCSSVAGGGMHTIALQSDGNVRCWGDNNYGQCFTPSDSEYPQASRRGPSTPLPSQTPTATTTGSMTPPNSPGTTAT